MVKRGSNHNATKFGIFARILLSGEVMGENEQDYLALLSGLRSKFRPADYLEGILVEKLAFLYLRLTRVYKTDVQLAGKIFAKIKQGLEIKQHPIETEYVGEHKEFQIVVSPKGPSPDLLVRYEANVERQIARTLEQLDQVKRGRQSTPEPPVKIAGTDADRAE